MRVKWLALSLLLIVAGCLPIELSVSPQGQKVLIPRQEGYFSYNLVNAKTRLLYAPPEGKPAFALYAPDEQSILAASQVGSGMMRGVGFKLTVINLADKTTSTKDLFDVTNLTYIQWSPDQKYISYTRISDNITSPMEENLPELYVVNVKEVSRRKIDANSSILHRWLPDSRAVLAVKLNNKTNDLYQGSLVKYDLSDKENKPQILAELICGNDMFLDVSPDGTEALVTAFKAGPAGQQPTPPTINQPKQGLYKINLENGTVSSSFREARYAIYSPDGKHVLVGTAHEDQVELEVADSQFRSYRRIATDAALAVGESFTDSTSIYPSWRTNDKLLYLAKHAVYGTAGDNLQLIEISVNDTSRRNLQATIDKGVNEISH